MTDTPETDNLARGNHVVPTEFAEKLERERDEAIEMMKRTRDNSGQIIASQAAENILLTEQRDRLAEALEYILGIGLTEKTKSKAEKALQIHEWYTRNRPVRKRQ